MLSTLQVPSRFEPAFLKTLAAIGPDEAWGSGSGDTSDTQTIFFDASRNDAIISAINGYDAAHLARLKEARIETAAALRRAAISDTFTFNGQPMKLDPETESAVSKAYSALSRQPAGTTIDWEVSRGVFVALDLDALGALGDAAFLHVQAAFSNAKRLVALIHAAEDLAALEAIDLATGW